MSKPLIQLTGTDGNAFSIIEGVSRVLKGEGQRDKAKEFEERAMNQESYDGVIQLAFEYVKVE